LEWNITAEVKQSGPLDVALVYQHGQHAMQIQSVTLIEDGREIGRDEHLGLRVRSTKITPIICGSPRRSPAQPIRCARASEPMAAPIRTGTSCW
jgi:hypothetical protein